MNTLQVINSMVVMVGVPAIISGLIYTGRKLQVIDTLADRIDHIESRIDGFQDRLSSLEVKVSNIDGRLSTIEKYIFEQMKPRAV